MNEEKQTVSQCLTDLAEKHYKTEEKTIVGFMTSTLLKAEELKQPLTREDVTESLSKGFKEALLETPMEQTMITIAINKMIDDGSLIDDLGKNVNYSRYMFDHIYKLIEKSYEETVAAIEQNKGESK